MDIDFAVMGFERPDRICAEPSIRYAMEHCKGYRHFLYCETPELFSHLHFDEIHNSFDDVTDNGLPFFTFPHNLVCSQFLSSALMRTVDFCSISSLRMQLPKKYQRPRIGIKSRAEGWGDYICIHAENKAATKRIPIGYLRLLVGKLGSKVVLVGNTEVPQGERHVAGVSDLRNLTNIETFASIVLGAKVVITNDSSAFHIASCGDKKIVLLPGPKRNDLLVHREPTITFENRLAPIFEERANPFHLWNPQPIDELPDGRSLLALLPDVRTVIEAATW